MDRFLLSRPRASLAAVGVFVVLAALVAVLSGDRLQIAGYATPGSPSAEATERLEEVLGHNPEPGLVVMARTPSRIDTPESRRSLSRLEDRFARDPAVARVRGPFGRDGLDTLRSRSGRRALVLVYFRDTEVRELKEAVERLRKVRQPGLSVRVGGYAVGELELDEVAREELIKAELIAVPLLGLLMLLIFRGFVAAAIPLVIGGVSMLGAYAALQAIAHVVDLSVFALNLAILLALGLAVDYALLLVSRYREEVAERGPGVDAARRTLRTAGRAVAFSGCAVAVACAPLMAFAQGFVYSMGIAGVLVATLSAGIALLVTAPLLVLAGGRIAPKAAPAEGHTRWHRWARWVMRHPVDLALIGVLLLVAAAAPLLKADWAFPDRTSVPRGEARDVGDALKGEFPQELASPVFLVGRGGPTPQDLPPERLAPALTALAGVYAAAPLTDRSGRIVGIQAILDRPPVSEASQDVVGQLRDLEGSPLVGGRTAEFIDMKASIESRALPFALLVAALTFAVLLALTRSVVLPLKALVFHTLVLAAVFGLLVLLFQDDVLGLGGLIGYEGPPALDTLIAVVIVASTFGLAADYSILLLARIAEEHRAGRNDEDAVALAVERTGPVITSAAILLCVALLALATSELYLLKELTIGQVLGVAIDVTLVRLVLVPAFIRLLGPWNWWLPGVRGTRNRV